MFGRFGFGGFGQQQEEEEPRGEDVQMRIRATLKDLYVGKTISMTRVQGVYEETSGKRQCNCRMRMITKQLGPGMYQQMQKQVCPRPSQVPPSSASCMQSCVVCKQLSALQSWLHLRLSSGWRYCVLLRMLLALVRIMLQVCKKLSRP